MANARKLFVQRKMRTRAQLRRKANGRPRLSVFRSGRNIYAQVINDVEGKTVASASTMDKALRGDITKPWSVEAASEVGKAVAERAKEAGVTQVAFDRGAYRFHGRVKALAEAAREAGLEF